MLLAATGLRICEALSLTRTKVDLDAGVLLIREAKLRQRAPRADASERDGSAARRRDQLVPGSTCERFLLRDGGSGANQPGIRYALQTLCQQLGWRACGDYRYHRLHDLRHTFIVRSTLRFYEQGIDLRRVRSR